MTKAQAIRTAAAWTSVTPQGIQYVVETYSSASGSWRVSEPMNYWEAQQAAWGCKVRTALKLLGQGAIAAATVDPSTRANRRREDWRRAVYRILKQKLSKFYVTHIDQYGEHHQIGDALEARTPEDALYTILEQAGAEDDGNYEVFRV